MNELGAKIVAGICAVIFLLVAWSSFYSIDQGDRGVITHYGAVVGEAEPGLHFKTPFVTAVHELSVRVQRLSWEHDSTGDARMEAYSRDQQPAHIAVSVNWHAIDVSRMYSSYQTEDYFASNLLAARTNEIVKNIFGQFDAADAIQQRAKFNAMVTASLQTVLKNQPILIDSVQIEDVEFSPQYEKAVEDRMQSIVKQQQAEAEKAKKIIDADAGLYEQQRKADAVKYNGIAEAAAIQAKNDALKNSPDIVAYTIAQKWDGVLPTTMVPGGGLPLLDINRK